MFLEISQNLQENTCARISFSIKFKESLFLINFIKKKEKRLFRGTPPDDCSCWSLSLKALSQVWDNFWATESPLKMIKNAFYFISKALFILKIFRFLSWFFGHVAKRLDKRDQVSFRFYDVTAWLTNNRNTHILANISRSKGNHTVKFGQLIECNMRNIFLEKS